LGGLVERIPATFSTFDGRATGAVLLLALLAVACQGQPIPLAAAQGSSVLIPIGGGGLALGEGPLMGYGSPTHDDWQRGRLRLWLDADPDGVDDDVELPVRGVARVSADRASPAGLSQSANSWELGDQVVVVVDVPIDAPLGPWPVYARRYMQQWNGASWQEQELDVAQAPSYHGALEVLPEVSSPTPLEAFLFGYWQPVTANVADLVPHPKLRFVVQASPGPSTPLGAARFTVTYPASRLAVHGVVAEPIDGGVPPLRGRGAAGLGRAGAERFLRRG
jgi:hypothetical protein